MGKEMNIKISTCTLWGKTQDCELDDMKKIWSFSQVGWIISINTINFYLLFLFVFLFLQKEKKKQIKNVSFISWVIIQSNILDNWDLWERERRITNRWKWRWKESIVGYVGHACRTIVKPENSLLLFLSWFKVRERFRLYLFFLGTKSRPTNILILFLILLIKGSQQD